LLDQPSTYSEMKSSLQVFWALAPKNKKKDKY